MEAALTGDTNTVQLTTMKLSLTKKKEQLATLDDKVMNLVECEQDISADILQSDKYKHIIYMIIACIENA